MESYSSSMRSKKNIYRFPSSLNNKQIIISSSFDSGNIQFIKQINQQHYRLAAVPDDGKSNNKKCWFHFKVKPPVAGITIKFVINNVSVLYPGHQNGLTPSCVCKEEDQVEWNPIPKMHMTHSQQPELIIQHQFKTEEYVYFALTIPFSHYDQIIYLENIQDQLRNQEKVYYHREVLTRSTLGFDVFVITISQLQNQEDDTQKQYQDRVHDKLFPTDQPRPIKINKPVVFINCRIHPGQVTSSHTLNGIIEFLISKDIRAYILRKLFVFVIVPMANPDGVFQGNYRMDSNGVNLNRVYDIATQTEYPEVFAIKTLAEYYHQDKRLQFFFDLHGHTSPKGAFIYGNALDNIVSQVESQIYCKLMEMNSSHFAYKDCCFSEKHMSMKDKNEPRNKQGCSRVVIGKITGLVHCLAMETGIYKTDPLRQLNSIQNSNFQYMNMNIQQFSPSTFLQIFSSIGKGMMTTLLDRLQKNPFSRFNTSTIKCLDELRKQLAFQILNNQDRFKKMDTKAYHKVKFIQKHYGQVFMNQINQKLNFIYSDVELQNIQWPNKFQGFKVKVVKEIPSKLSKQKNTSQSRLSQPILSRKLIKSMSQGEKLEQQTPHISPSIQFSESQPKMVVFQQLKITQIKIIKKLQQMIDNRQQIRNKLNKNKILSTRRLLKQFSNERQRVQSDRIQQTAKLRMASPINIISRGEMIYFDQLKQKVVSKLDLKKNQTSLRKGINRLRTDQLQDSPALLIQSDKLLPQYSQALGAKNKAISITQPQNPMNQQQLLQRKNRKMRNFKREILNVKFSDIRKRGSLKLPQIKKSGKNQQILNLEQLRKDIQIVKLISATNSHLAHRQFD